MNFPAASHGVSMNDTIYPNPDKPELKIDPPEAERFMVSLRSVFSI